MAPGLAECLTGETSVCVGGGSSLWAMALSEVLGVEGAWGPLTHLEKQCAAVRTQRSVMRLPPQKWLPLRWMLTCQGHSPSKASWPPTIRFSILRRPHTRGQSRGGTHWESFWFLAPHSRFHFLPNSGPSLSLTCGETLGRSRAWTTGHRQTPPGCGKAPLPRPSPLKW